MEDSNLLVNATKEAMIAEIGRLRDREYLLEKRLFYKDKKLRAILDVLFRDENSEDFS